MRRHALAVLIAGTVAACSLTTSFDDLTSGTNAGTLESGTPAAPGEGGSKETGPGEASDAQTSDGAMTDGRANDSGSNDSGSTGDAGDPPSVLVNGGFESAATVTAPCGEPWSAYRGLLAKDSTARSGTSSCRVCGQTAASFTNDYGFELSPPVTAGQTFHVRAWVRKAPGSAASPAVTLTLAVYDSAGTEIDPGVGSPPLVLTDTWTAIDLDFKIPVSGLANTYVDDVAPAGTGECFLMDDVVGWVVP